MNTSTDAIGPSRRSRKYEPRVLEKATWIAPRRSTHMVLAHPFVAERPSTPAKPRRPRWRTVGLTLLGLLIVALVALRLALPTIVRNYVNRTLSKIPGYRGEVGEVDIHLWRGAYTVHDANVVRASEKVPVPFFSAKRVDLSVQWRELLHRALVGEIELDHVKLNFVKGPTSETSQTTVDSSWQDRVKELFPLRINRFEIRNGEIHYRDFHSKPPVDVLIDRSHIVARNLTNSRKLSNTLAATIDADGRPLGDASLTLHVKIDPYQEKATFESAAELKNVDLTKFNDFARAYGGFDFQSGRLNLYTEVAAAKGRFTGYLKPLITDLQIPDWDEHESFLQRVWGVLVGATAKVFRNHPKDRFATRVDFAGSFDNPNYSLWEIVGQVLKNTFIKAIPPGLEGDVSLGEAEKQNAVKVEEAQGTEAEKRNTAVDVVKKRAAEKKRSGEAESPP
jgi:Domain of Unknown Function (DUF748)